METAKVLYNGKEITIPTIVDEEEKENNFDDNLEETMDLTEKLSELEKTIEYKKEDFYAE